MPNTRSVDWWVDTLCLQLRRSRIYPTVLVKATSLPISAVYKRLVFLANDHRLVLSWEVRCPNYECVGTIDTLPQLPETLGYECECPVCFENTVVDLDIVFPVFKLDDEYRNDVIEQVRLNDKKKRNGRLKRVPPIMTRLMN